MESNGDAFAWLERVYAIGCLIQAEDTVNAAGTDLTHLT